MQQAQDLGALRGADYDEYYRTLELGPGASLQEIEDRAELLKIAFDADSLPEKLKGSAEDRSGIVERAAEALRHYWQTHGTPPPSADLTGTEGLLDALVQALGDSAVKAEGVALRRAASPAGAAAAAPRPYFSSGRPIPPAGAVARRTGYAQPAPPRRDMPPARHSAEPPVQRIEIALELVHRHVLVTPSHLPPTIRLQPPLALPAPERAGATEAPSPIVPAAAMQARRAGGHAVWVKLGAIGLAIGIAAAVQQFGLDWVVPRAGGSPAATAAPAQPGLMMSMPRSTGAFAQPVLPPPSAAGITTSFSR